MLKTSLAQKNQIKLHAKQIRFLNFLKLDEKELDALIEEEITINPFLVQVANSFPSTPVLDMATEEINFTDILEEQLRFFQLNLKEREIANFILHSLNSYGFLDRNKEDLTDDFCFSTGKFLPEKEFESVVHFLQKNLEPKGCCQPNLKAYLLHILEAESDAYLLVKEHFEALASGSLADLEDWPMERTKAALAAIRKMKPYPAFGFAKNTEYERNRIKTSYTVDWVNGKAVGISNEKPYSLKLEKKIVSPAEKDLADKAKWLVDSLKERQESMQVLIEAVVKIQQEFFANSGDTQFLKPMTIKDLTHKTSLSSATISRLTSKKYMQTNFGIIPFKSLFSECLISKKGIALSTKYVQEMIKKLIEKENPLSPYTDRQLLDILQQKGLELTRRTITKYRELQQIPAYKQRLVCP